MSDFPRMMYRKGKETKVHNLDCDTRIVADDGEETKALSEGWALSPAEAHGVWPDKEGEAKADPDNLAPTPDEYKTRISELEDQIADLNVALAEKDKLIEASTEARIAAEKERDELLAAPAKDQADEHGISDPAVAGDPKARLSVKGKANG